jgi:hypothetical protein
VATPRSGAALALAVVALAAAALSARHTALRLPEGGWDAHMIWNLRARLLWLGGDVRHAFDPALAASQPDYPILLPSLVVAGWTAAGAPSSWVPLAIGILATTLALAILAAAAARHADGRAAALSVALAASTPFLASAAVEQSADVLVMLFTTGAGAAAWIGVEERSRRALALAGLLSGFAAFTKNEGQLLVLALGAGVLLRGGAPWSDRARELGAFAAGAAAPAAVLLWFKLGFAPPASAFFPSEPLATKLARAADPARLGAVLLLCARRVVYFQAFGMHVAAAVLAFAALAAGGALASAAARGLALAMSLAAAAAVAVYAVAPFDARWLVYHSADRLILQYWPLALLWLAAGARLRAHAPRAYLSPP